MATVLNPNATEDEPLRIKLEEDAPANGEAAPAVAPALQPVAAPETPAAGIDDLKRQLDESARNRQQWQQHARQLAYERDQQAQIAAQAQERGILAEEVVNETNLRAANEQLEALKESAQAAYESGQWDKVNDANVKIGRLGGRMAVLEQRQEWLQSNRQQFIAQQQYIQQQRQVAAQQAAQQQAPAASSDPFERALAGRTQRTQQFLRDHRDLVRPDGTLKRAAIEAHERALDEGKKVDTEEYFEKVEEYLASDEPRSRQIKNTSARPKPAPHTAAPVSRGGSVPGQISGSEFVMTPHMRELAQEQGIEPAEWAANYVRLVREGRIDPIE